MKYCKTCNKKLLPTCNRFCTTRCMRKVPKREWAGTKFGCYTIISFHSIIGHRRTYLCTNHKGDECIVNSGELMHAKTSTSIERRKKRRESYHANKIHYIQYREQYRIRNPQVNKRYEKENKVIRTIDRKYRMYRATDLKQGHELPDFTVNNLLMRLAVSKCIYCGSTSNLGLDRIDNSKGHTKSNTVIACHRCNTTRWDNFTVDEMKQLGKVIRVIDKQRLNL